MWDKVLIRINKVTRWYTHDRTNCNFVDSCVSVLYSVVDVIFRLLVESMVKPVALYPNCCKRKWHSNIKINEAVVVDNLSASELFVS